MISLDKELETMAQVYNLIVELDPDARLRMLTFIKVRIEMLNEEPEEKAKRYYKELEEIQKRQSTLLKEINKLEGKDEKGYKKSS